MEEAAPGRHTAAGAFLVPGEGDVDHLRVLLPQPGDLPPQGFALRVPGGKLFALVAHGHKLHKDDRLAAPIGQLPQKGVGADLPEIPGGHGDGGTEDQAAALELVHIADETLVYALAAPGVGDLLLALNAQNGHQVAAAVKELKVAAVDEGAVGEDGEEDVGLFPGGLDDVPSEHGLAARQENEADAQRVRLLKDAQPLRVAQLLHGRRVHGGVVAAGIAACTVEVALAGDAGDQKGRDVLARVFRLAALFGGGLAGRGKAQHEGALPGVLQGGLQRIPHHVLYACGHIGLQVKALVDPAHVSSPRTRRCSTCRARPEPWAFPSR